MFKHHLYKCIHFLIDNALLMEGAKMNTQWEKNSGKNVKIAIIDSGIDKCHSQLKNFTFKGVCIKNQDGLLISDDITDTIGHGTAVAYIITKIVPEAEVFIIKLFDKEFNTTTEDLINTLKYIDEQLQPDIIHLSNGVTICDQLDELEEICNRLTGKGIIMIAAFDNGGAISYPAAFKNVIGVDFSIDFKKVTDFQFIEGDIVNIRGIGKEQRLPWIEDTYKMVSGASFSAPYVTAYAAQIIEKGTKDFKGILNELRSAATIVTIPPKSKERGKCFKLNKAVVFPFNKEIHSLVRFSHMLSFQLMDVYDYRLLCNIGKNAAELIGALDDKRFIIKNIDKLDWEADFDTIILGHMGELSNIVGKDLLLDMLKKCKEYRKNVYAFDDLSNYEYLINEMENDGINIFYPKFLEEYIPTGVFGKLRKTAQPVLGVFGTSPKQGKFTLQLTLRSIFMEMGYSVGQLGTEPSALLYGMDEVYPIGYGSTVKVNGSKAVAAVNYLLGKIQDRNPDIIIVGSQSQTIPLSTGNLGFYPIAQHELILGSEPDAYVLCVNINDEIDYINRTILYLESVLSAKVIALVIFPLCRNMKWSVLGSSFEKVNENLLESKREELSNIFQRKTFILNHSEEMTQLTEECIDYFT